MKTTDFLAEIIKAYDLKDRYGQTGTAYSLWKHMHAKYGWTIATVSNYFKGETIPSDEHGLQIADELGWNSGYVLAWLNAERAKSADVKKAWLHLALTLPQSLPNQKPASKRAGKSAKIAGVILALSLFSGMQSAERHAAQVINSNYVSSVAESSNPRTAGLSVYYVK